MITKWKDHEWGLMAHIDTVNLRGIRARPAGSGWGTPALGKRESLAREFRTAAVITPATVGIA